MLYRVALQGFAEWERRSIASFLRETSHRAPSYQLASGSAEADVILADGNSAQAMAEVVEQSRISTTLFLSELRPIGAAWHVTRPTNPVELLFCLDELVARLGLARETLAPRVDDAHALAKAAARRAARRARLAARSTVRYPASIPPDVLVLDASGVPREHLCTLLENFGFCAYPARSVSQAIWLVENRTFAAAFLDIALDDSDGGLGVELCRRLKSESRDSSKPASALFIVSDNPHPIDRVLAALAGCTAFLTKPLSRGDVARALEGCQIPMPADARHA